MKLICTVFGNHFDLRSTISAIFSGIAVRDDGYFLDGLLIGREDRRAAPGQTIDTRTVNCKIIATVSLAIRSNLHLIFYREDGRVRAPRPAGVRQVCGAAVCRASAVAKHARSES